MEISDVNLLSLLRTLEVLQPYLGEIVIVGGWVPFLYRKYGHVPSRHPSVRTIDIDVVVPRRLEENGRPTIDVLLSRAGYEGRMLGPSLGVVKYELADPVTELEFLTPEVGRPGPAVISVQSGLNAQALRYLQIILDNTEKIRINEVISGRNVNMVIRVPSPGAFIYQKGLTLPQRKSKISKDLYYIFDMVDSSEEMRNLIPEEIGGLRRKYTGRWFHNFIRNLARYFPESGAEGPALVATQYTGLMTIEAFRNYVHRTFTDFIMALQETMR